MGSRFHFNNRYQRLMMYALMLFLAYIFAFPLLFMLVSSFKPDAQIFKDLYSLRAILPSGELSLDNYQAVFEKSNIVRFFYNSMFITGVSVLLGLLINSMAAFALARLRWSGQAWILAGIIALLIVPFEAIVIPLLMLVAKLPWIEWQDGQLILAQSWLNSYHVQILPGVANAFPSSCSTSSSKISRRISMRLQPSMARAIADLLVDHRAYVEAGICDGGDIAVPDQLEPVPVAGHGGTE